MDFQFLNGTPPLEKLSWAKHLPPDNEEINDENLKKFFDYMYERHTIWYKRFILKKKAPWTDNPILREYKFTNVYRELDRASQYLINNVLRNKTFSLEDILFKTIVFRFYNQPDTFISGHVKLPNYIGYSPGVLWKETIQYREEIKNPWHTAYMMNMAFLPNKVRREVEPTIKTGLLKDYAYCMYAFPLVHKAIKKLADKIRAKGFKSPEEVCKLLEMLPAVASFQSHEFYLDFCYLNKYSRFSFQFNENDYTNVGPGCSLGIRLIFPCLKGQEQKQAIYWLRDLAEDEFKKRGLFPYTHWNKIQNRYVVKINKPNITLHQIEFSLCEFSKLFKMEVKAGKQRSKFSPITKEL